MQLQLKFQHGAIKGYSIDPQSQQSRQKHPQPPKKITYSCGGTASAFGFFSNT
jgi:hypothetical protein